MLVSVGGAGGCGKSTVISQMSTMYGIPSIDRKTSRSILSDWGVSLDDVNVDPELAIKFQEEILLRKQNDERIAINSSDVWLTERSYADLFVYAIGAVGRFNKYNDWIDGYYQRCCEAQNAYLFVAYIKNGYFDPIDDGVRGINTHYSVIIDLAISSYTQGMSCMKVLVVDDSDIRNRIRCIKDKIDYYTNERT